MSKVNKRTKIVACISFLALGIGFCIAGIFYPGLMVMGGSFLASGLALASNILGMKEDGQPASESAPHQAAKESTAASTPASPKRKFDIEQEPTASKRRFFGFMNKKFMKHHEDIEHVNDPNETESNAMHISPDLLKEIRRVRESLEQIDKLAQGAAESRPSHEEGNTL